MSISPSVIGRELPAIHSTIERGRLRFFAEAIGERNPVYTDLDAARDAGYPDLPVPPTFLFGLKLDGDYPLGWIDDLGVDTRFVLHGTQRFDYERMAFAGDELVLQPRITSVFEKRGGALEFIVVSTDVTRGGEKVAVLSETIVVRHPEKEVAA
jgi:hypothetical protein